MSDREGRSARSDADGRLEAAIARFVRRKRIADAARGAASLETMTSPAFRAVVADHLRALERDLAEVRARVNGLLFVVAGAVVTQVVLRLFA